MRAIRKMEPAWEKVNGGNFSLVEYRDKKGQLRPCYSLTKTECLYIATKFNDEARCDRGLMRAIRNMEPAWEKTCGLKFQLTSRTIVQPNGGTREVPCYSLTKTECLYIATKFNDEARAKLVLRWEELEMAEVRSKMADVKCTLRHCCVTFFVKDLYKCKKTTTFVTKCEFGLLYK